MNHVAGSMRIVAIRGEMNDWAAYWGAFESPMDWIIAMGDKLPKEVAEKLFPKLVEEGLTYRE